MRAMATPDATWTPARGTPVESMPSVPPTERTTDANAPEDTPEMPDLGTSIFKWPNFTRKMLFMKK